MSQQTIIHTTREALNVMLGTLADKAESIRLNGYTDSDYDVMENYLTITNGLLSSDFEDDPESLPRAEEAPWCPQPVIDFLPKD